MTDQVYFIGYRAEHFTGWDGTGSPIYTVVGDSDTSETNKLGYINLNTSGNVIWKDLDITDTSKPVYIMMKSYFNSSRVYTTSGNIFLTDGDNLVSVVLYGTNSVHFGSILTGKYSSGGGINITSTLHDAGYVPPSSSSHTNLYIKLSSSTSGFDTVSVVVIEQGNTEEYTIYSGSITPLSSLKSIFSCCYAIHDYISENELFYCAVANFDLSNTYLDYSTASSIGSTNQWSGDVNTFSTYPVSYNSTGGMYSNTNNTSVSYKLSKTLNTTQDGYDPLAMIISSNDISSNKTPYTNGYNGKYTISIPNYLASGTGISVVFYNNSDHQAYIFEGRNTSSTHVIDLLTNTANNGDTKPGSIAYSQYDILNGNIYTYPNNNNAIVHGWNIVTLFSSDGKTFELNCNRSIAYGNITIDGISSFDFLFRADTYSRFPAILASIAHTTSPTVNYPFDKDNNVTSYIDFVDPNNPVVYGDTTQLAVTSKSLTSTTAVSDVPKILITSTTKSPPSTISPFVTDGTNSITTSDTATVTSSGNNSTFYLLEDPLTNSSWTSKNIQKYQFGLTKID